MQLGLFDNEPTEPTKVCTGCHERKALDLFSRRQGRTDGRRSQCKACEQEDYRQAHPEQPRKVRADLLGAGLQVCHVCHEAKPLDAFSKSGTTKSGRQSRCKVCYRAYYDAHEDELRTNRIERYRRNPVSEREQMRAWRTANAEYNRTLKKAWQARNRERLTAKAKEYYQANAEYIKQRVRAYAAANDERIKQYRAGKSAHRQAIWHAWYVTHREMALAAVHRRSRRVRDNGGTWTAEEWIALKEQHDYRCLRCGKREPEIKLTFDHVIPVLPPYCGRNDILNAQPLCMKCNLVKGRKCGPEWDFRTRATSLDTPPSQLPRQTSSGYPLPPQGR